MLPTVLACAFLAALLLRRATIDRRRRDERARRHPPAANGVVPGADALDLDGGRGAVLLIHGFGDTPQSLMGVARALHAAGFSVRAPLLPGHGRSLEAFARSRAREWKQAVLNDYNAIASKTPVVAVAGVSMGGALACDLVASLPRERRPATLALVTPYMHRPRGAALLTRLWPLWSLLQPWVPGDPAAALLDPVARAQSLGYGMATPRLLRELRTIVDDGRRAGPDIRLPTLAVFSTRDYRIPADDANATFARLGSTEKELHWVSRSGHVVTADYDAAEVAAVVCAWVERSAPKSA